MSNITYVQNSSIQVKGISKVALVRKSSILWTGGISTLFSWENWVSFLKEMCKLKAFWSGRIIHFMKSTHFRWNGETHVSYGTIQCVGGRSVLHLVSLWELSCLLKGILPTTQCFYMRGTSPLGKKSLSIEWKKHCVSWQFTINVRSRRL
jgi:hypothetical protein